MDIVGNLPEEVAQMICMRIEPDDMYQIKISFPHWLNLLNSESFWEKKCKLDNFYPIEESSKSPFYKTFIDKFDYWQATYFYNQAINYNWKNNIFREIPLTNVGSLREVHYFDDEMLIASTTNNSIQIFNSSTGIIEKYFNIDKGHILYITKQNNIMVCITEQRAIIWNIETECELTKLIWDRNQPLLRKVCIHKNLVAVHVRFSSNRREDLYILNLESKSHTHRSGYATEIELYNNMVVILENLSINVLNLLDQSSTTLACYSNYHDVEKISVKNEYVIGLCKFQPDVHLSVWNIETFQLIKYTMIDVPFINPFVRRNLALFEIALLDNNKLAYSFCKDLADDIPVRVLDYITGEQIFDINYFNDESFCQVLPILKTWNNNIILSISLSNEGNYEYARMLCPNTGKILRTVAVLLSSSLFSTINIMLTPTKMLESRNRSSVNILSFEM